MADNTAAAGGLAGGRLGALMGGPWGMLLASLGPMLFNKFFAGHDPAVERMKQLKYMLDPERMRQGGINQYQQDINGPAFQSAQRDILSSGDQFANKLSMNAARAGLDTSSLGALVNAGSSSLGGINIGKLKAAQFNESRQAANNRVLQSAGILGSQPLPTNYMGGFAGAGLNAMLQYMLNQQKKPALASRTGSGPLGSGFHLPMSNQNMGYQPNFATPPPSQGYFPNPVWRP